MVWFLVALAILLLGGLVAVVLEKSPRVAALVGASSAAIGGGLAMLPSLYVLLSGHSQSLRLAWSCHLLRPTWNSIRFPRCSPQSSRW